MQADWELSQTLTADGQGIRCAAVLAAVDEKDSYRLIAGNQGGGLVEFSVPSGNLRMIAFQHDHAVTALLSGRGVYVTACKDGVLRMFDSSTHELLGTLNGHEKPVTSLAWCDPKERWLVTGSWDGTAIVWNVENHSLVTTLPNHENSVCVAGIAQKGDLLTIATGSAGMAQSSAVVGHSTRLWTVNVVTGETVLLHTVSNDHDGPIRDILFLDSAQQIVTCSNDGTVKIRDAATGTTASTLVFVHTEHPPMLLSVAAGDNYLAAGAEDGHVVVWDMSEGGAEFADPQILRHAECVWNVVALPEGDLASCCQDGTLRIFTRATERMASAEERDEFAADTQKALASTRNGPSAEEVAKLHRWEMNAQKRGTSEGQVHLFNKNGVAIAAQWSAVSQTWIEVGQVTGQADEGVIDGVQYDHVFPIEVDQTGGGVATLKIGYNNGENPFSAAQRFIDSQMLPQHHLSEIADYITQRVGKHPAVLGRSPQPTAAFTGSPIASYEYLPPKTYKAFDLADKATLEKMKAKIQEFGCTDLAPITSLTETLAASNRYHASTVADAELSAISTLLKNFTESQSFPALDLARLAVLHPDAAASSRTVYWHGILQRAVALCQTTEPLEGPAAVAVPMLALRLFCNAFKGGSGSREAAATHMNSILDCAEKHVKSTNKNIRLSVATLLYNVCFYLNQLKSGDSFTLKIVPLVNEIISAKTYESEALFRTLVALGSLVMVSQTAKDAANALFLASKVEPAASPHGEQAKVVAKEVYSLLA